MQELAERTGIDPTFYDHFDFAVRNETLSIRSKKLHKLGLRIQSMIPLALQDALLPLYLKINGAGRPKADAALKAETAALKRQFAESNKALAALFPAVINLDLWR